MAAYGHRADRHAFAACAGVSLALLPLAGATMPPVLECDGPGLLAGAEEAFDSYAFQRLPEGFVAYRLNRRADDALVFIVEHCPGGARMTAIAAAEAGETAEQSRARMLAVEAAVQDAIDAPRAHTLRDLARLAEGAGAVAWAGPAEYESCACRLTQEQGPQGQ